MRKTTSQPSMLEAPTGRQAAFPLERKEDALAAGAAPSRRQQKAAPTAQGQCSAPAVRRKQAIPRLQRPYQAAPTSQGQCSAPAVRRKQAIPRLQRPYQAAPTPLRNQVAPASKGHVVPHSRKQVVGQQRKTKRISHWIWRGNLSHFKIFTIRYPASTKRTAGLSDWFMSVHLISL